MALLDDIELRLSTQSVAGIAGTTSVTDTGWLITKSFMPPDPDKCITIYETGGFPPLWRSDMNFPTFQVKIRSSSTGYSTGRQKLADAETALHAFESTTLNGVYYGHITALGDALSLGFDGEDRPILAQNYYAARSRT